MDRTAFIERAGNAPKHLTAPHSSERIEDKRKKTTNEAEDETMEAKRDR
jgi:hypothetical protein